MTVRNTSAYARKIFAAAKHMVLVTFICITAFETAYAQAFEEQLQSLEQAWDHANFVLSGKQRRDALSQVLDDARGIVSTHRNNGEAAAWHGIIASSYLDTKGAFRRKALAIEARDALLRAVSLGAGTMAGMTYANLGALFDKVPGGFAGFGDKSKAIFYLWKAISADPEGVESNFLYARYLLSEKKYRAARNSVLKAQQAVAKSNDPFAHHGRQQQLAMMMTEIDDEIGGRGLILASNSVY